MGISHCPHPFSAPFLSVTNQLLPPMTDSKLLDPKDLESLKGKASFPLCSMEWHNR